jgi:hypothetical protein
MFLGSFTLNRSEIKAKIQYIEVNFTYYSLQMEFDSLSKLQMWYQSLSEISSRIYCELVRCPEQPQYEKEYVLELTSQSIKLYNPQSDRSTKELIEWKISVIKRAKYHSNVGKVEIEVGRKSTTGPGRFFFIGHTIVKLYKHVKNQIDTGVGEAWESTLTPSKKQKGMKQRSATLPILNTQNVPDNPANLIDFSPNDLSHDRPPLPARNLLRSNTTIDPSTFQFDSPDDECYATIRDDEPLLSMRVGAEEEVPPPLPPKAKEPPQRVLSEPKQSSEPLLPSKPRRVISIVSETKNGPEPHAPPLPPRPADLNDHTAASKFPEIDTC